MQLTNVPAYPVTRTLEYRISRCLDTSKCVLFLYDLKTEQVTTVKGFIVEEIDHVYYPKRTTVKFLDSKKKPISKEKVAALLSKID